jgi:ElaB/YqjD/DUF883 family membrane-anchored ribosome-binding protein
MQGRVTPASSSRNLEHYMFAKTYAAADAGGSSSAVTDVETELTALRADVKGLAESIQRLAVEAPSMARASLEESIRREPLRAIFIAAGIGFVLSLVISR